MAGKFPVEQLRMLLDFFFWKVNFLQKINPIILKLLD